jgi:hypothetical protein
MANLINELTVKISEWENNITLYKNEYKDAQSEMERINSDISDEMSEGSVALDSLTTQRSIALRKILNPQNKPSKKPTQRA